MTLRSAPVIDGVAADLLDALPDATAVLDPAGNIIAVNEAWRLFAVDNGGMPGTTGVGVNYLDVCLRSATDGCKDAVAVAAALQAVLDGATVEGDMEYPCPTPSVDRWFMLRITPIGFPVRGALVSHLNITSRKRAELELERQASHDPLTSVPNRRLLADRLAAALAPHPDHDGKPDVGLLFVDLDGFKEVNDRFGHATGDEVLQVTVERMRAHVRPQDTVARYGGDEFVILAPRISPEGLDTLAARIIRALDEPHQVHGEPLHVRASVGKHLAANGDRVDHALHMADQAMYAVKNSGRPPLLPVPRKPG